ncbi:MAG: ribosomal-processing cysteine protease Prp [Fervidobacterium sp.]
MIRCKFNGINGTFSDFEIVGHASYSKKGQDIVCAAVSAVSQHTARALEKDGANVKIKEGYLKVEDIPNNEISQRFVSELIKTLEDIAQQYPSYIHLEVGDDAH